jgi:hypothetical protein
MIDGKSAQRKKTARKQQAAKLAQESQRLIKHLVMFGFS